MPQSAMAQPTPHTPMQVWDVRDYGALGDGKTMNTVALQAAIDACSQGGGGSVFFPKGSFLSGTIVLKDNVTLYFAPEATLLGSPNAVDYPAYSYPARNRDTGGFEVEALIYADGAKNIGIAGPGTLEGNGKTFPKRPVPNPDVSTGMRPRLVYLKNCLYVRLRDITLRNSSGWTLHLVMCDKVFVQGVSVYSDLFINQDGIDIDSCQDCFISDCFVSTVDDAIVIKATFPRACKNLAISNCALTTRCTAIKFGSQSVGGFQNISISNCALYECDLGGLKFEAVDGGDLEDVTVSNITMHNVSAPITFLLGNRAESAGLNLPLPRPIARLRNVVISGIRATVANEAERWHRGNTCLIAGIPGHPIEGLTIDNVTMTYPGGGTREEASRVDLPEHENMYPDNTMFGVLPAYGFYLRHVKGISLTNVRLELAAPELRPALISEDVEGLDLTGFKAASCSEGPVLRLRNTRDVLIQNSRPLNPVATYLLVEGTGCSNIAMLGNDLRQAHTAVVKADGFLEDIQEAGNLPSTSRHDAS